MTDGRDRLHELLALRSTEGLGRADSKQATRLMAEYADIQAEEFERAATAVHLAMLDELRVLPPALEGKLIAAGERFVRRELPSERPTRPAKGRVATLRAPGWWAAAAVLAVAVIGWWPELKQVRRGAPQETLTTTVSLDSLIAEPDTVRLPWSATEDVTASAAAGEVVWNNARQAGFMRFSGLAANDPTDFQYQLWIFDRARDERYPVDGGVFDVTAGAQEVVVPIDARIRIGEPYLFAITVEPPGGVVVSTRERIALVAQPV